MSYEGGDNIYFTAIQQTTIHKDTVYNNFARKKEDFDTVFLYVGAQGQIYDFDRKFALSVDKDISTAVEGVEFKLPTEDELIIPANENRVIVPIVVYKTESFYQSSKTFTLRLDPNEFFKTDMLIDDYAQSYKTSSIKTRVTLANILRKPDLWDENYKSLGQFSRKKLELLVSVVNLNMGKFYDAPTYFSFQIDNYAITFQKHLNEAKDKGEPILEEDGTEMKMGEAAQ